MALEHAVALWRASGGRLSLVHVGPFPLAPRRITDMTVFHREGLNAGAREWLRRRADEIPGSRPAFLQGPRGPATCAWADDAGVDLVVVGAGSGRTPGLVPGEFVHHLLEHASCAVLVVRPLPGRR